MRSIDSFAQLEYQFTTHFSAHQKVPHEPDSLFAIRRQDKESLKDYLARFKVATLKIYDLDDSLVMSTLKRGFRPSRITFLLDKKLAHSYSEVLLRAKKYICVKEGANARREVMLGVKQRVNRA